MYLLLIYPHYDSRAVAQHCLLTNYSRMCSKEPSEFGKQIFLTPAPSSFGRSGSSNYRTGLVSMESVTLRRNDIRNLDVN